MGGLIFHGIAIAKDRQDPDSMHVSDEDIQIYLRGDLGRLRLAIVEIHLAGCAWCQSRVGETWNFLFSAAGLNRLNPLWRGPERRREVRVRTNDLAVLQVVAPFSDDRVSARVMDISKSGLQVSLALNLEPGAVVKVKRAKTVFFGQVRYCRLEQDGQFRAGLLLQEMVSADEVRHIV